MSSSTQQQLPASPAPSAEGTTASSASSSTVNWTHQAFPSPAPSLQLQQFQQLQQLQQPLQQQITVMQQQTYQQPGAVSSQQSPRFPQLSIVPQQFTQQQQQGYLQQQAHPQSTLQQHQTLQQPQQPQTQQQQRILGTAYTPEQREALEEIFSVWDTFTKQQEREETFALSKKIGLTTIQIRGWIQNRKKRGQYKGKQVLAPEQVRILEWVFVNHSNYPSVKLKQKLACELGLKYSRIRTWFQSRRQRGVPAVLTRISQENDAEWNETVQKLRTIIEAVKVEDAFFLRFPFKGSEGEASPTTGTVESPSLSAEGASPGGLKSRAGPLQIPEMAGRAPASSKMVSSPPLMKDTTHGNVTPTSFSPPASLPSRPATLNFPPEGGYPMNLGEAQKRKGMNYMWKGTSVGPESPKRRRMTQIPSKASAASGPFIPPCGQLSSSPQQPVRNDPIVPTLPSWRENLARLSLEGSPSSARSPGSDGQSLPRLQLPQFGSPDSPKHAPSAFVSSDPGVSTKTSWTAAPDTPTTSNSDNSGNGANASSPSSGDESANSSAKTPKATASGAASTLPLLPSIRELERAAERSNFSIPPIQ